jgi:RNA polymerase sigma-19 factor, ECF subfamily
LTGCAWIHIHAGDIAEVSTRRRRYCRITLTRMTQPIASGPDDAAIVTPPADHDAAASEFWQHPRWARGVRAGDARVFDALVRELGPSLCAYVYRYVESREAAEELVQEVFANLWINRSQLVIRDSIRTYLYRAVTNRGLNAVRNAAAARRAAMRVERAHMGDADSAPELSPSEAEMQRSQLQEALREAVTALPERARLAFELVWERELTYAEAAAVMGVSVKTVDSNLARAVRALRKSLRSVWP